MTLLMRDNQMREEGRIEGRIQVYRNLRKKGFSKEEALAFAEIPASAVEDDEDQTKPNRNSQCFQKGTAHQISRCAAPFDLQERCQNF
ncbi:hypothetical protein FYJ75_08445 [Roseburia sp. MUC/MUC-530-WT-4D]|uniref:Uncharacterized protein n=1 Tax=Roseburia porci TaxID=2605790 RepID=A0A6L5YR36_9FIRM|nr:hypothetical protein [Roseburia porci]MST75053.1 hypothetical protein [Roseburia porci]